MKVAVPSWRPDVHGQGRYCRRNRAHPRRRPHCRRRRSSAATTPRKPVLTSLQIRTRKAKRALAARGLVEAVTWSFVSKTAGRVVWRRHSPNWRLPIRSRPIFPTCGRALFRALPPRHREMPTAAIPMWRCSRSARSFKGDQPEEQFTAATGVRRALAKANGVGRHWSSAAAEVDAFDAKADALAVLAAAGVPAQSLQVVPGGPAWFHPGRSGTLQMGPQNRARPFRRIASAGA